MNLAAANKIAVPPNCPSRSFARAPPEALGPCCSAPPASPIVVVLPAPDRGPPEQRRAGACELAPNLQSVEGAGRSQRCLVQLRFARKISAGRETPPGFAATPRPGAGGHAPGHVTVRKSHGKASSCEHDLPGVLHSDGTGVITAVLQVELSSPCTLGSLLSYNTWLYSTTTSYKPHCPTTQ